MLKPALVALSSLTLLAVGYLTLSVLVLWPPRASLAAWLPLAVLLATQCVLTLIASSWPHARLRFLLAVGGVGLIATGLWMVNGTLTSGHFEGYALVLGLMLAVQGVLTVAMFLRRSHGLSHAAP